MLHCEVIMLLWIAHPVLHCVSGHRHVMKLPACNFSAHPVLIVHNVAQEVGSPLHDVLSVVCLLWAQNLPTAVKGMSL